MSPRWSSSVRLAGALVVAVALMACAAPAPAPAAQPAPAKPAEAPKPAAAEAPKPAAAAPAAAQKPAQKPAAAPAAPAAPKPAQKPAEVKVIGSAVIGLNIDASSASIMAGVKKGFFRKYGVDASQRVFPSGQEALEAVLTGQADSSINGQYNIPLVAAQGGKIRIITEIERSNEQFGAVAKNTIKTPKDLEGKKVGTQLKTSPEYYLRLYIQKYGLDASKINIQNIAFGQLVPALAKGDIDAFFAFEPHLTRAVDAVPGTAILHRSGQDDVMPLRVYWGVSEKVYTNKEMAIALLKGLVEAGEWSNKNRDELAQMLVDEFKMKLDDAKRFVGYFDYSVRFNKASLDELDRVNKFLVDNKILAQAPDLSKFVDSTFMKEAAPNRVQ